jgi:alkanesulfonate monooxygenase SsuD/methylene tetrahydromethanopterin reductase-like flavin-dependent oxidoreductase (luciferase family)
VFIRDDRAEAERRFHEAFERNRVASPPENPPIGTPEDIAERLAPYVELGYRHLDHGVPAPYDEESMARFVTEVRPLLEKVRAGTRAILNVGRRPRTASYLGDPDVAAAHRGTFDVSHRRLA